MKHEWVVIFLVNDAISKLPTTARKISISELITVLNRGVGRRGRKRLTKEYYRLPSHNERLKRFFKQCIEQRITDFKRVNSNININAIRVSDI